MVVEGWDYPKLVDTYEKASAIARKEHCPVFIHVVELTQPQGHSTSGSHERYKSEERLNWEKEHDCNLKFREWVIENDFATSDQLDRTGKRDQKRSKNGKAQCLDFLFKTNSYQAKGAGKIIGKYSCIKANANFINSIKKRSPGHKEPLKKGPCLCR